MLDSEGKQGDEETSNGEAHSTYSSAPALPAAPRSPEPSLPQPSYPHSSSPLDENGLRTLPLPLHSVGMATPTNSTTAMVIDTETIPASPLIMPLPLREEPTLKEKLVERERQRRVETERARLKRQFALMSNGGGLAYENTAASAASISSQVAVRENGSIAGTVGEESTVAHAELDDEIQDQQRSNQELGYTMERFLLERDVGAGTGTGAACVDSQSAGPDSAEIIAVATTVTDASIPAASLHAAPITNPTTVVEEPEESAESTATDKGVVMERFLSEPVHVEPAANAPQEGQVDATSVNAAHVHRSVSFDMESHHQQTQGPTTSLDANAESPQDDHDHNQPQADHPSPLLLTTTHAALPPRSDDGLNVSLDSNASVKVEVADDIPHASSLRSIENRSSASNPHGSSIASIDRQSTFSMATPASLDQTRVLRLTEAEIQEMASIEEASIGNAPPSERSLADSSLVGELVGDFTGSNMISDQGIAFSQGTPTTAVESVSIVSGGNQSGALSADRVIIDRHSLDDVITTASDSSHLVVSPGASIGGSAVSVTANPPSVNANPPSVTGNHPSYILEAPPILEDGDIISPVAILSTDVDNDGEDRSSEDDRKPAATVEDATTNNELPTNGNDIDTGLRSEAEHVVNRRIRPGMVNYIEHKNDEQIDSSIFSLTRKRSTSLPENMDEIVDDFDYDKDAEPASPRSLLSDSYRDLPGDDNWQVEGKMTLSPLHPQSTITDRHLPLCERRQPNRNETNVAAADPPGRTESDRLPRLPLDSGPPFVQSLADQEPVASMRDPRDTVIEEKIEGGSTHGNKTDIGKVRLSFVDALFRDIDLVNDSAAFSLVESENYISRSFVIRAGQERLLSLLATCLVELPVLSILLGGSDHLCTLTGRRRYHLLVGFIPLVCAISGNLSLQASTLTNRAIFHKHVNNQTFIKWLQVELATSAVLGLKIGTLLGVFALLTSEKDLLFALTIFVAQFMSCVSAGFVGISAPVVVAGILKGDVGKWNGIITSFQDIIGCFTVVFVSYFFLVFIGSTDDANSLYFCGLTENVSEDACAAE